MSVSPNRLSKTRLLPALCAEECIAHQLAEIGLRLHKLGRLKTYQQVIGARNDLLAILDKELALRAKQNKVVRSDFALVHNLPMIDGVRPKQTALKVANHAR